MKREGGKERGREIREMKKRTKQEERNVKRERRKKGRGRVSNLEIGDLINLYSFLAINSPQKKKSS